MILIKHSEIATTLKCSLSHIKTTTVPQRKEKHLLFFCTVEKIYTWKKKNVIWIQNFQAISRQFPCHSIWYHCKFQHTHFLATTLHWKDLLRAELLHHSVQCRAVHPSQSFWPENTLCSACKQCSLTLAKSWVGSQGSKIIWINKIQITSHTWQCRAQLGH